MHKLAAAISSITCWNEIIAMYHDPRRVYHGANHVTNQLKLIGSLIDKLPSPSYAAWFLTRASLFHDCFYEIGLPQGVNEQVSAEYLKRYIPSQSSGIFQTILATAHFDSKEKQLELLQDVDAKDRDLGLLFLDIDLHTFQNPEDGKETQDIIQEAVNFGADPDAVVEGRKKFLLHMQPRFKDMYHLPFPELALDFNNEKVRALHLN